MIPLPESMKSSKQRTYTLFNFSIRAFLAGHPFVILNMQNCIDGYKFYFYNQGESAVHWQDCHNSDPWDSSFLVWMQKLNMTVILVILQRKFSGLSTNCMYVINPLWTRYKYFELQRQKHQSRSLISGSLTSVSWTKARWRNASKILWSAIWYRELYMSWVPTKYKLTNSIFVPCFCPPPRAWYLQKSI